MTKPNIIVFSPHFELRPNWDYDTPYTKGIGGSESFHIELCNALVKEGHNVTSYAPIGEDKHNTFVEGVLWLDAKGADSTKEGIWLFNRTLVPLDYLTKNNKQKFCVIMHDVTINEAWTDERIEKLDKVFVFSRKHEWFLSELYPKIKNKIQVMKSGCDLTRYLDIEKDLTIKRNPRSIIWASCPTRGLSQLLEIFTEAKEVVPDLTLDIFYGMDLLDLRNPDHRKLKTKIEKYSTYPGITLKGKIPKQELIKEWLTHGLWVYPTAFLEVFCMAAVEAQTFGAIPIVNPLWGVAEQVNFGNLVRGSTFDPMVQARFVEAIIAFATNEPLQEELRKEMMLQTRIKYNWDIVVKDWSDRLCRM